MIRISTFMMLLLLPTLAAAAINGPPGPDTIYVKFDQDVRLRGFSTARNSNHGSVTTLTINPSDADRLALRCVGIGDTMTAQFGDSMYCIAAKVMLRVSSITSTGDINLRKFCRKFDEMSATWYHYKKVGADTFAFTTGGAGQTGSCLGNEDTGDSTGVDVGTDWSNSGTQASGEWLYLLIDPTYFADRDDSHDSLNFWVSRDGTYVVAFYSAEYTTDTTLTPRIMLIANYYDEGGIPGALHHGDANALAATKHHGDGQGGTLHKGD